MRSRSSASWRIACGPPGPRPPRNDHRRSRDASAGAGGEARAAMPSSQHRARCRLTLASIGPAVLVYCADELRPRAAATMPAVPAGALFTDTICARIAGLPSATSKGRPGTGSPTPRTSGPPPHRADATWTAPIRSLPGCGEHEWAEGSFANPDGIVYSIEEDGRLAAAGNLTPFRGHPADVGLAGRRPDDRRRAGRRRPHPVPRAGQQRTFAGVARSLGFAGYGRNLMARLPG